ncbi:gluconate 2-dehydrogenase subunit 3 family protein [Geodermatophilus sp. TF02-6]|nr:gluconate 2-dehydrogenase subunit 3 family protein [Geodermatophilus sp. TF02-6]
MGLDGQVSEEGGIRVADAAVAGQRLDTDPDRTGGLADLRALDQGTARALVSMTRAMYPHDRLPDVHYERVVAALDEKAAADARMRILLTEGVGWLATTTGRYPSEFGGLPEAAQVAALTRLQETPFFQAVAAEVVVNLYSQHDVWPYFGYEGPSTDEGGYLHRGFDDVDWLDDAPDRRDAPVAETIGDERDGDEARIQTEAGQARSGEED